MYNFLNINTQRFALMILVLLFVTGIGLRLINIHTEEFWYDEVVVLSISNYGESLQEVAQYSKETFHPPVYFFIMRFWTFLFGLNEFSTRFFSLIFSVLFILSVYYFGKRLFNNRYVALTAALFATISPLQVEYGQEARPYALLAFLALWSFYFFWRFIKLKQNKHLFVLFLINIIGLYTHYDFFVVFLAQLVLIVALKRALPYFFAKPQEKSVIYRFMLYWIGSLLLFLPWVVYALLPNITGVQYAVQKSAPLLSSIFLEGDFWFNVIGFQGRLQSLLMLFGQATVIYLIYTFLKSFIVLYKQNKEDEGVLLGLFLISWYIVCLLIYFISPLSTQYTPNWQRHIIIFSAPLYFIVAYGINLLSKDIYKKAAFIIIIISISAPLIFVIKNDSQWDEAHQIGSLAQYIESNEQPGDFILFYAGLGEVTLLYYFNGDAPISGFLPLRDYNSIEARTNYYLPSLTEAQYHYKKVPKELYVGVDQLDALVNPYRRVWLIGYRSKNPQIINWFNTNWKFVDCPPEFSPSLCLFENLNPPQ